MFLIEKTFRCFILRSTVIIIFLRLCTLVKIWKLPFSPWNPENFARNRSLDFPTSNIAYFFILCLLFYFLLTWIVLIHFCKLLLQQFKFIFLQNLASSWRLWSLFAGLRGNDRNGDSFYPFFHLSVFLSISFFSSLSFHVCPSKTLMTSN
jgi:hypothetical protein